jgi:hypothetical protein
MLTLYVALLIVGGALVVASMFGAGHGDADVGAEVDADVGGGALEATGADAPAVEHGGAEEALAWLGFFGLRFWTWAAAFAGLTGLALRFVAGLREPAAGIASGLMGLLAGASASATYRLVARAQTTSAVSEDDLVGQDAEVVVALGGGEAATLGAPGKVRVSLRGEVLDLVADTHEGAGFAVGAPVTIVASRAARVTVVRRDALLPEPGRAAHARAPSSPRGGQ